MRAARLHQFGSPPRVDDIAAPGRPADGQLLVDVTAAGVGSWDEGVASGRLARFVGRPLPLVMGAELVGRVAALGPGVEGFDVGQRVMGNPGIVGAWAEQVVVSAERCGRAPKSVDDVTAAAVPVGAVSALQATTALSLEAGDTLLVLGAGGSVGRAVVQLASTRGATVLALVPGFEVARTEAYGATSAVDQATDWAASLRPHVGDGVTAMLDLVGGSALVGSLPLLRPDTRVVTTVVESVELAREHALTVDYLRMRSTTADLDAIADLVDAGDLKMPLGTVRPFGEVRDALEDLGAPRERGKVVLRL